MANIRNIEGSGRSRGFALILALMILLFLTILAIFALYAATRALDLAGKSRLKMEAFYTAKAGLNRTVADLLNFYKINGSFAVKPFDINLNGNDDDLSDELPGTVLWTGLIAPSLKQWLDATEVRKVIYFSPETSCLGEMKESGCVGFRYEVRVHLAGSYVRVLSLARYHEGGDPISDEDKVIVAMEQVVRIVSGSACNGAMVIGGNQTTQAITGGLEVHGGLHVLCEDTDLGKCAGANPPANCWAIAPGVSVGVYNDYQQGSGQAPSFMKNIQPLNKDEVANPTLNARVLVQNCGIGKMDSASNIGTLTTPMDLVIADGGVGGDYGKVSMNDDLKVNARERFYGPGEYLRYMGADAAVFPMLLGPEGIPTALGGSIDAESRFDTLPVEWCNIGSGTPSMNNGPSGCACPDDCYLCWDGSTRSLTSNRDAVYDLSACEPGATIGNVNYKGKATFFFGSQNLTIDGNVNVADRENFPITSAFGFVTAGEMNLAPQSRSEIMGLLYAQQKITMTRETAIAGIVMSNSFNPGKYTPQIYQVPSLDTRAPEGFRDLCGGRIRLAPGGWRVVY